jgi:transcriptional regulator with XRE-family HTH domain
MENILMRFCRETQGYTPEAVAARLGISVKQYKAIESGKELLTARFARKLGKLYKQKGEYFYAAGMQVEMLRSGNEIIRLLKNK